jgi:eukaryotic-like serine/threonine-protein kinase
MGVVYRAEHQRLGKPVAVKLMAARAAPAAAARFEREMRAVGRLDHPAIVRATDAGSVEGRLFLAMELIDGVDLRRLLRHGGPLSVADACEIVRQAAIGLQAAHQAGVVHRDMKPSNLMLNRDGQVKILDFGLAATEAADGGITHATSVGQAYSSHLAEGVGSRFRAAVLHVVRRCPKTTPDPGALEFTIYRVAPELPFVLSPKCKHDES